MNAVNHPVSPAGTLRWLLKREYWENRGGFLYAPLIAGIVSLLMSAVGIGLGLFALHRAARDGGLHVDGEDVNINGLDLALLTQKISAKDMADLGNGLDLTLLLSSTWPFLVLAFVVFFYCLGALYDDRRDRSILFWKSLPLSDTQTVLSKVISALVIAPLVATLAAVATMFGFLLIISIVAVTHGGSPTTLIWGPASPVSLSAGLLAAIPVYALWALPTAGWLLLCSAWAKSKPFLWAVMLPLFAGIIVSTTKLMHVFDMTTGWFWQHIVARLLLGTVPGVDLVYRLSANDKAKNVESLAALMSPAEQLKTLAMPDLWIGAAFGVAFIILAIRLRKRAGEI
ncbi:MULTISPECIES: hypothetical protein [unclassified Stenotrophomonas]|uniref:hypothetical protein n=1 Tax=unclassified Stenotrophomonas TaxID=196198 RepID=UPI00190C7BD8|nr:MULTISPECIES: hypothetical protein [unclassified Stenotrophomonas]MBK0053915.1 hypothetical protein [Stenotrophomonas sp. S39]MDI9272544.1 hypothetical protein [Stenotrophomonas sp. PFBMAA-4]